MVAAALFINYIDRGALPQTVDLMQSDLHLTIDQIAALTSAFFWPYALSQMPVGWLAERYGAQRVLAAAVGLWAIATLLFGLTSSVTVLILLRVLLGFGESAAFPCASVVLAQCVPVQSLGRANGVTAVGYLIAPAFGMYFGGRLVEHDYGSWLADHQRWRVPFVVFGALSLLWLWPWLNTRIAPVGHTLPVEESGTSPSFGMILRQRALWGAGIGHFMSNYTFYFMLSWLPFYLVTERGFSHAEMTAMVWPALLLNGVGGYVGGWFIDRWMQRGASASLAYKTTLFLGSGGAIVCMLAIGLGDRMSALIAIYVFQFLCGVGSPGVFAVSQIFAGPRATARWVGIQNSLGNMAGIVGPPMTAYIVKVTGHFQDAFLLGAVVATCAVLSYVVLMPKLEPIQWAHGK